jgi:hypothetical protein
MRSSRAAMRAIYSASLLVPDENCNLLISLRPVAVVI